MWSGNNNTFSFSKEAVVLDCQKAKQKRKVILFPIDEKH